MRENIFYKATVPSNIAFLKYWGKRSVNKQWAANNSISMTLSHCVTMTQAKVFEGADHEFYFANKFHPRNSKFAKKAYLHLDFLCNQLKTTHKLQVYSKNLFPSGCGIASSASGFGALTLAVIATLKETTDWSQLESIGLCKEKISQLSRLGSGSSCRSFWGGFVQWNIGASYDTQKTLQLFPDDHWKLWDVIILFSTHEKSVPSSQAHKDAWTSPLFSSRLDAIKTKECHLIESLQNKDLDALGRIIEKEALEMHQVMMTSTPPAFYLEPESLNFLSWLIETRLKTGIKVFYTIDAGPNIHLICDTENKNKIIKILADEHPQIRYLVDQIGKGPSIEKIES